MTAAYNERILLIVLCHWEHMAGFIQFAPTFNPIVSVCATRITKIKSSSEVNRRVATTPMCTNRWHAFSYTHIPISVVYSPLTINYECFSMIGMLNACNSNVRVRRIAQKNCMIPTAFPINESNTFSIWFFRSYLLITESFRFNSHRYIHTHALSLHIFLLNRRRKTKICMCVRVVPHRSNSIEFDELMNLWRIE